MYRNLFTFIRKYTERWNRLLIWEYFVLNNCSSNFITQFFQNTSNFDPLECRYNCLVQYVKKLRMYNGSVISPQQISPMWTINPQNLLQLWLLFAVLTTGYERLTVLSASSINVNFNGLGRGHGFYDPFPSHVHDHERSLWICFGNGNIQWNYWSKSLGSDKLMNY